jgi:antitoxin YefM
METIYKLNARELTPSFISSIRDIFADRDIEVTVRETWDETAYLLNSEANREHLLAGIEAAKQGKIARSFTIEELETLYP